MLSWILPPSAPGGLPALDGLRALAVLLVLWHHFYLFAAWNHLVDVRGIPQDLAALGFSGVQLFFVLSGFLLFLPYARSMLMRRPWPSARTFYTRRILRILPAYYVALVVLIALLGRGLLSTRYVQPLFLMFSLLHDSRGDSFYIIQQLDSSLWTLAVEWQFYLALPWIAALLRRLARGRDGAIALPRLFLGLLMLIFCSLSIRWVAAAIYYDHGLREPYTLSGVGGFALRILYGAKGKYLETFALGMGISVCYIAGVERRLFSRAYAMGWALVAGAAALLGWFACLIWAFHDQRLPLIPTNHWVFTPIAGRAWAIFGEWALGMCFALLLICTLFGPARLGHALSRPPLRFIGVISYSLYIWHWPLLVALIGVHMPPSPVAALRLFLIAPIAILLVSTLSYVFVERPFLWYRRQRDMPLASAALTSGEDAASRST